MFQDLDKTLNNLLNDATAAAIPAELLAADVSFQTPDKNYKPTTPDTAVNLFLYEVKENRVLRDPVPIVEQQGNNYIRRQAPLRVDCFYIVTAWKDGVTPADVTVQHRLLGQAFLWLSRFPAIPATYFSGGMIGQPFPPPTMVAQWDGAKNNGEFWSALGIPPRPYFTLTITIAMDLGLQDVEGPPVVTKQIDMKQREPGSGVETTFEIAGVVRNGTSQQPIDRAQIRIVGTGRVLTSNTAGQFRFSGLKQGNYTLRVSAVGFTTKNKSINVPGTVPNSYDVGLT